MLETLLGEHETPFEAQSVDQAMPRVDERLKMTAGKKYSSSEITT